jgi:hypothetical protein
MDDPQDPGAPVELSEEETMVMLGCYAETPVAELSRSTGLPVARVETILQKLTDLGLIDAPEPPAAPEDPLAAGDDLVALLDAAVWDLLPPPGDAAESAPGEDPEGPGSTRDKARPVKAARPRQEDEEAPASQDAPAAGEAASADPAEPAEDTRESRKLFETEIHPLPVEQRVALAGTATGARLFALCFDPDPIVIAAMFENTGTTVDHARLIALHHRMSRGLDEIASRAPLLADATVHRRLVRNPGLSEATMRRILGPKRLGDVFRVTLDRDVPERTRVAARGLLRSKFATAQPDERVDIVWSTEGRILLAVPGLTFDGRTTSMLCSKSYVSVMLVTNLARFTATPPVLIAHLLRQPLVRRQQHLRNMLLQHPNTPSDAKRRF